MKRLPRPGWTNRLKRGPESEKSEKITRDVDCEIGVFSATVDKKAVCGLKPKEKLQSASFEEITLELSSKLSYRSTADTLNRVFHREGDRRIRVSTLENRVESFGNSLADGYISKAEEILGEYNIDKQTGIITPESSIPKSAREPELPEVYSEKEVRKLIMEYNRDRDSLTKLKFGKGASYIEVTTEKCCYIRIDDVGVKYQKPSRKAGCKKDKTYVENTVVHIEAEGRQYTLTAVGMDKAFKQLVAFLLNNRLMENYRLIFFSDGARTIRDSIGKYFGFRQYTLILDWFHLEKKCREFLSMIVKGTKAERNKIKNDFAGILWTGRYDKALKYLDSIKNANIKNAKKLENLRDYINRKSPNITCYALRHELGLSISSSRVEKANDMVVASRQKHNGMSWSTAGSGALAVIKASIINGELHNWAKNRTVGFTMSRAA